MELNINEFIDKYIEEKHSELLAENKKLNQQYNKVKAENILLKQQLETLNTNITSSKSLGLLQDKITLNNIKNICELVLPLDNNITSQFKEDAPLWFELIVKHWSNKDIIISLLKELNVNLPLWINNIKMPYEYNEKELDLFFKTLHNHYVCNNCVFNNNLGFWYREFKKFEFDITRSLNHNYSETPWQLVLRNPLLLEDAYLLKIAESLNKQKTHSEYFLRIFDYQTFSEEKMKTFIHSLKYGVNKNLDKFIEKNINLIENQKLLDTIFDKTLNGELCINILQFPNEMQKKYYTKCKDVGKIINATCLTKEEKVKLIEKLI